MKILLHFIVYQVLFFRNILEPAIEKFNSFRLANKRRCVKQKIGVNNSMLIKIENIIEKFMAVQSRKYIKGISPTMRARSDEPIYDI